MQRSIPVTDLDLHVKGKPKVAILASRFNEDIVEKLIEGAFEGLIEYGVAKDSIHLFKVPGAFELPLLAQKVGKHYDGCIALGAVIRGETSHFDFVAGECARGIAQVSLALNMPIMFGVLTTDTLEQAVERAGTKINNKGFECALNLIEMLNLFTKIK
jgi:6,7-dimethyl-8-ribityllumazine synthase